MKPQASFCSLALLLASQPAAAQCVPTGKGAPGFGPDYVYLTPNAAMNSQSPTAVTQAVNAWRSNCFSYGSNFGFPIPTTTPVTGASYSSITVKFISGTYSVNPSACAVFPGLSGGNTIEVFEQAVFAGQTVQCSSFGYDFLIAHELGHFFKLADIMVSGCPTIMGQADGFPHSVTAADCVVAKEMTQTPSENLPPPMCNEPCTGGCTIGGSCLATQPTSPILVPLGKSRIELCGLEDPVRFDIANEGELAVIGWTARGSDTAFLALDRNENGRIDHGGELFGDRTPMADGSLSANGFTALAQYDSVGLGGNGDLRIDSQDAIYDSLRLWLDRDHDALVDPGELMPLTSRGVIGIDLDYRLERLVDRFGNRFWLRGSATRSVLGGDLQTLAIYDVSFVRQ